ncbi:MAG TPA: hypothetical protein VF306_20920 [Pirellulales bacterium]
MPGSRLAALLCLAIAIGCAPPPPSIEDLGQIVYDPTQVPGADRPYTLPHGLGEEAGPPDIEGSSETADRATPSPSRPQTAKPAPNE